VDDAVHGIILQLPLPSHLDDRNLMSLIPDEKDVDGIKEGNVGCFLHNIEPSLSPTIAVSCDEILRSLDLRPKALAPAQVVMLGIPPPLRKPLQLALCAAGWSVKVCGQDTVTARAELQLASVLLVGERRPDLVAAQWVRDGCLILDLGLSSQTAPTPQSVDPAEQRDVRCLCCSDGLSAITAALRMRNASHCALLAQGFLDCRQPELVEPRKWRLDNDASFNSTRIGGSTDDTGMTSTAGRPMSA